MIWVLQFNKRLWSKDNWFVLLWAAGGETGGAGGGDGGIDQSERTDWGSPADWKQTQRGVSAAAPPRPQQPHWWENRTEAKAFYFSSKKTNTLICLFVCLSRCWTREDGLLLPRLLPVLLQRRDGQEDALQQPDALRQAAGETYVFWSNPVMVVSSWLPSQWDQTLFI